MRESNKHNYVSLSLMNRLDRIASLKSDHFGIADNNISQAILCPSILRLRIHKHVTRSGRLRENLQIYITDIFTPYYIQIREYLAKQYGTFYCPSKVYIFSNWIFQIDNYCLPHLAIFGWYYHHYILAIHWKLRHKHHWCSGLNESFSITLYHASFRSKNVHRVRF